MATYIAYISINDTDGRSKNFTTAPTVTVWNGRTKAAITTPSPTLTNITTGLYSVDIELDTKTDVLFKVVPHVDDEEDIADIKVIHEGYIETVEELGVGVKLHPEQGGVRFAGQVKIIANAEEEGALHIVNENETGFGNANIGGATGQNNYGAQVGQANISNEIGQYNYAYGDTSKGQLNGADGDDSYAQYNHANGANSIAQKNESVGTGATNVSGYDPAIKTGLALEATLTAMKGAGWTDETLVAILEAIEDIDISTIPDDILSTIVVDDMTVAQVLKVLSAVEVGTVSGGGGATFSYTGKDGTKVTLSGVDENGNRSVVNVEF